MASPVHYEKLLTAARTVIAKLQAVPELEHVKVCIIGGFAVWQKYRDYRETEVRFSYLYSSKACANIGVLKGHRLPNRT